MTPVVQDFLTTFDRPTDSERLELASEILKRTAYLDFSPLSDEDLVLISEGIFLQLIVMMLDRSPKARSLSPKCGNGKIELCSIDPVMS